MNSESPNKVLKPDIVPEVSVRRYIHDIDKNAFYMEIVYRGLSGKKGILLVPRAAVRNVSEVADALLNAGAVLPPSAADSMQFVRDALAAPASGRLGVTRRCGWHGESFVTPNQTLGDKAKELRFKAATAIDPSYGITAGTLAEWKEGLRAACAASTFLTFALGVGFGAPVLDLLGEDEGAVFNFFGDSSGGKSLAARACMSEIGRARKSDPATYDITDRGVEEICFAHNDSTVVFDEQGRSKGGKQVSRARIRDIAYMVPGGHGKVRSAKVSSDLPTLTWRTLGMSSGEEPLEDGANRRAAGEQLRHIDIKIPDPKLGGIFDRLQGTPDEKVKEAIPLAAQVEATIAVNYGVAQVPFVAALVANRSFLTAQVKEAVADFIEQVGADNDSWERRYAAKFAIVAAGAVIAADYGVAPFTAEHALRCVKKAYRVARRSVFTVEEAVNALKASLRSALADDTTFPRIEKGQSLPSKLKDTAWGFRRKDAQHGQIIAIAPARFIGVIGSLPAANAVLAVLTEKGIAIPGSGGKSHRQMAVQGFSRDGRGRWVCVRASAI